MSEFGIELGDVIICGTDGVFDNLSEEDLTSHISPVQCNSQPDPIALQKVAHAIALQARALAFDSTFLSPFAKEARTYGINALGKGSRVVLIIFLYSFLTIIYSLSLTVLRLFFFCPNYFQLIPEFFSLYR